MLVDKRMSFLKNEPQNRDLEVEQIARQMRVTTGDLAFADKALERRSELDQIEDKIHKTEGKTYT